MGISWISKLIRLWSWRQTTRSHILKSWKGRSCNQGIIRGRSRLRRGSLPYPKSLLLFCTRVRNLIIQNRFTRRIISIRYHNNGLFHHILSDRGLAIITLQIISSIGVLCRNFSPWGNKKVLVINDLRKLKKKFVLERKWRRMCVTRFVSKSCKNFPSLTKIN